MAKTVAVILSGCGVFDGAEIHEAVLTLLRLDQQGVGYQCFAPDMAQAHVIDHASGLETDEQRNVLTEAARIARGAISPLSALDVEAFDAVVVPGGFGVAKNLSDFAVHGAECRVQPDFERAIQGFHAAGKPIGLICVAPVLSARLLGPGVECTIGSDPATVQALEQMGARHHNCRVDEVHVDQAHKLVTTPAYMLAKGPAEAASGIFKLVDQLLVLS